MRKEDATEPNYVALLQYFRARYPGAEHLRVFCETSLRFMLGSHLSQHDLDALRDALEGRPVQYSPKVWEGDAQAVLERGAMTEQIRYKLEGGDLRDLKCVQVTPRDPDCAGCPSSQSELARSPGWAAPRPTGGSGVPCYFLISDFELDGRRFVRLLMDAGDGSVENLVALLEHFSEKDAGTAPLVVKVLTSLDQEHNPFGPTMKEHFTAALFRDQWNEVIRYRGPGEDETSIVVRGTDVFPDLDDARGTEGYPWMPSSGRQ
jgi:hypothetical protein